MSNPTGEALAADQQQLQKIADQMKTEAEAKLGFVRNEDGSVNINIRVEADIVEIVSEWAIAAGETVPERIQREVGEALNNYVLSQG